MDETGTVFDRTCDVLVRLNIAREASQLSPQSDLEREFGIDSLQVVSLLVELEAAFGIELDPGEITHQTVTQMPELLGMIQRAKRRGEAAASNGGKS